MCKYLQLPEYIRIARPGQGFQNLIEQAIKHSGQTAGIS